MISDVELRTLPPQAVAVVRADVRFEDLAAFLGGAFEEVATALGLQGVSPAGPPFGRYVPQSDGTSEAYEAATDWMGAQGDSVAGQPWESELDEPDVPDPRTEVFLPCTTTGPAS